MLTRPGQRLRDWTTLRLGGPAARFVEVTTTEELYDVVAATDARKDPCLVLGGGSNLVVADEGVPATVVRVTTSGLNVRTDNDDSAVVVTAQAGEDWDALVTLAVNRGWTGIEALSGIPGSVGAVPIQNVGAYGQEVADTIVTVDVYDRHTATRRTMPRQECRFDYRSSVFKRSPGRFVVGAVTFRFPVSELGSPIAYGELARALGAEVGERRTAAEVRRAVLALRAGKGMVLDAEDHDTWSAGSFFTNPILAAHELPAGAPAYPQPDGQVKTSAAWLIEQAGFARGYRLGPVALSTKHTLALTNRGGATTRDLLHLAATVRAGVEDRFGIRLVPEPTLVNCAL